VSIAQPEGLSITSTSIPNYVPADAFSPTEYHGLGRVSLGNALGYMPHIQIVGGHQLVLGLPDDLTLLSCSMKPGMTVTVEEIVRAGPIPSQKMPWDRSATLLASSTQVNNSGTTSTTDNYTYTVPTGKWLFVEFIRIRARRTVVATTAVAVTPRALWTVGGAIMGLIDLPGTNLVGDTAVADSPLSMYLPAGTVIVWQTVQGDTGGTVNQRFSITGLLFDA